MKVIALFRTFSMIAGVLLVCFGAAPLPAEEVSSTKLPHLIKGGIYYPETALRRNEQGRILIEFRISKEGRIIEPKVVAQEPANFISKGSSLPNDLRGFLYDVSSDWEASGNANHVFRLSIVFLLKPCTSSKCLELAAFPADGEMTVTTQRLGYRGQIVRPDIEAIA